MIITTVKKVELNKEKTKFKASGLNLVSVWECKIDVFGSIILKRNFSSYSDFTIIDFRGRFDKQYGTDNFKVYAKHIYRGFSRGTNLNDEIVSCKTNDLKVLRSKMTDEVGKYVKVIVDCVSKKYPKLDNFDLLWTTDEKFPFLILIVRNIISTLCLTK